MAVRRSFKTDESFLEKLAIGVVPSRYRKSAILDLKSEIKRSVVPPPACLPEKLPTFFIASLAHRRGEGGRRPGEGGGGSFGRSDPGEPACACLRAPHRQAKRSAAGRRRARHLRRLQHHRQRSGWMHLGREICDIRSSAAWCRIRVPLRGRPAHGRTRPALEPTAAGEFAGGSEPAAAGTGVHG